MHIATFAALTLVGTTLMALEVRPSRASDFSAVGQWAGVYLAANEPSQDFQRAIKEALEYANKANEAGKNGNHQELVRQSQKALDLAKEAQRAGHNERLNEGVYALGEAIEHGQKQQTHDAREHVMHAIMKLSQSADLQIPEGAVPPAS